MHGIVKNMQKTENKVIRIEDGKIRINKRLLKIRVIAILVILLIAYSLGEIIVRIFDPQELYNEHTPTFPTYPKEVEYDQDLGWATVKNYEVHPYTKQGRHPIVTITHNSQGYRMDHEVDSSKDSIVITGDSFPYGFWVDDKKIVSARLNELLGEEWEVINLGVGGYGTGQSLLRFMRDGLQYKPKVVVHTFFNNDFSNTVSSYQYNIYKPLFTIVENGALQLSNVPVPISPDIELSYPKNREHSFKGFKRLMRSWSHLYILYKNKVSVLKSAIKGIFIKADQLDYFNTYKDGELWAIEREYTDIMEYSFQLNSLILREYNRRAIENNITFILAVIGDRISVDPKMQRDTIDNYYNINDDFFDFEKPYRLLEEFAKRENIKIINLLPIFKEEFQDNEKDPYLDGDHHMNDHGHDVFAKEIYKALIEENLI